MIQRPSPIALMLAGLVAAFLLAPLLAVVPISLTPARFLTMPNGELSLIHYRELIDNPDWGRSILLSLRIGLVSSVDRDRAGARLRARHLDVPAALRGAAGRLRHAADDRAARRLGDDPVFLPDQPFAGERVRSATTPGSA